MGKKDSCPSKEEANVRLLVCFKKDKGVLVKFINVFVNLFAIIKHILNLLYCVYFVGRRGNGHPIVGYRIISPYSELWDEDKEEDVTSLKMNSERESSLTEVLLQHQWQKTFLVISTKRVNNNNIGL